MADTRELAERIVAAARGRERLAVEAFPDDVGAVVVRLAREVAVGREYRESLTAFDEADEADATTTARYQAASAAFWALPGGERPTAATGPAGCPLGGERR